METVGRELIYVWYYFDIQLRQIIVYWIVGMAIGSGVSVFAKDSIHRLVPELAEAKWGILGILPAAVLGMLSPLCMYGTIPIAASFRRQGIREDWLASFMMTSVLLNPQLMIYSAALGGRMLMIRILSALICGLTAGVLIWLYGRKGGDAQGQEMFSVEGCGSRSNSARGREGASAGICGSKSDSTRDNQTLPVVKPSAEKKEFFNFKGFDLPESRDTDPNPVLRYLKNFGRNLKSTGLYFLMGILLSALFQRYVPAEFMTDLFGGDEAWGVLMAATIGVPLYVCGGGTIPLLQQWLAEGMSRGSAAAFMITGPATKITNLGAVKIVLGMKGFLCYLAFVMVFSLVTGLLINLFGI